MYRNKTNKLGIKLPRKVKKVYTSIAPERSYKRIYRKMSYHFNNEHHTTVLFKILDYVYYIDDKAIGEGRGFKPSWPEITHHRLYKVKQTAP